MSMMSVSVSMSNQMNKECPNHLDPLVKSVWHVPKPIPSLFLAPYVERKHERDERECEHVQGVPESLRSFSEKCLARAQNLYVAFFSAL